MAAVGTAFVVMAFLGMLMTLDRTGPSYLYNSNGGKGLGALAALGMFLIAGGLASILARRRNSN